MAIIQVIRFSMQHAAKYTIPTLFTRDADNLQCVLVFQDLLGLCFSLFANVRICKLVREEGCAMCHWRGSLRNGKRLTLQGRLVATDNAALLFVVGIQTRGFCRVFIVGGAGSLNLLDNLTGVLLRLG